ncbi:MAG TPA: hypothetical protein VK907_04415, partial [Phnomibacter sp.]|nr:hypothetical protein [Phnomibacter sp.]
MIRYTLSLVILTLYSAILTAQSFEFTENKGQWHPEVRFKGELSVGAFFLRSNGYRVLQHHPDDFAEAMDHFKGHKVHGQEQQAGRVVSPKAVGGPQPPLVDEGPLVRSHAYDVVFDGGAPAPQILPEREMQGYANYFIGDDPKKWASGVKTYGAVRYSNIYPGVDVRYFSENGYLKYDIIVHPGADPSKIALRYDGATIARQKTGELLVRTSVSEVVERAPYTYQLQNGIRRTIDCRYEVTGNTVRFQLGKYDNKETLVIDPTLVFSTFAGSTTDNWGYTATFDAAGNAYGGGIVFGNGWPTTIGAFQRAFGGGVNTGEGTGFDMGIMKLTPNGSQRIFSTYLGGSGNEQPHSLVVDGGGHLIVAGRTTSTNFPTTANGRIGSLGGWDIVVTKFTPNGGGLVGSVMMGGADNDGVNIKHKTTPPTGPSSLFQNYGDDARSEVLTDRAGN